MCYPSLPLLLLRQIFQPREDASRNFWTWQKPVQSTKRDYKGKMTIFRFGQDICWRVSKLRRLGILLKAVKCRVRKPLSIPASTPNIYFQPRAISTHSICSSWWLSFAPKRSPLSPTTSTALIFRAWLYFLLSSRWVGASSVQGYNLTSSLELKEREKKSPTIVSKF